MAYPFPFVAGNILTAAELNAMAPTVPFLKPISAQYYPSLALAVSAAGDAAVVFQRTYYAPFYVPETTTYNQMLLQIGNSYNGTGVTRMGIYNETQGKPSTLVLDAGTVACTTATAGNAASITISQSLSPGMYFLAANSQTNVAGNFMFCCDSSATERLGIFYGLPNPYNGTPQIGYYQTGVAGAFATAGTTVISNRVISVFLRKA